MRKPQTWIISDNFRKFSKAANLHRSHVVSRHACDWHRTIILSCVECKCALPWPHTKLQTNPSQRRFINFIIVGVYHRLKWKCIILLNQRDSALLFYRIRNWFPKKLATWRIVLGDGYFPYPAMNRPKLNLLCKWSAFTMEWHGFKKYLPLTWREFPGQTICHICIKLHHQLPETTQFAW